MAEAFFNNFSAGESLDTTYLGTSVGGSGTADVDTTNKYWRLYTASTTDGALGYIKTKLDKTCGERVSIKWRVAAQSDAPVMAGGLYFGSTPAVGTNTAVSNNVGAFARLGSTTVLDYVYFTGAPLTAHWLKSDNTWGATQQSYTINTSTDYTSILETRAGTGTFQWRWIYADANGAAVQTSPWTGLSGMVSANGSALGSDIYVFMGDPYTTIVTSDLRIKSVKREVIERVEGFKPVNVRQAVARSATR